MVHDDANLKSLIEAIPPPSKELLPLFAVTVHLPGQARWKVYARAADEADVRAMLERRGHAVVEVRRVEHVDPTPATPRTQCLVCGYDLNRLPAHARGEVICPECGVINPAIGNNTGPLANTRPRSTRGIIITVGIMVGFVILFATAKGLGIL